MMKPLTDKKQQVDKLLAIDSLISETLTNVPLLREVLCSSLYQTFLLMKS